MTSRVTDPCATRAALEAPTTDQTGDRRRTMAISTAAVRPALVWAFDVETTVHPTGAAEWRAHRSDRQLALLA